MKTLRLTDAPEDLARAAELLRRGGLVAFPTETVYGLGANGLDAAAAAGIYRAKGRPSDNPLILHIADEAMLERIVQTPPEAARKLMRSFWPGPLTLILRRRDCVPDDVCGALPTVGVRMPDHAAARALLRGADLPIAAPSANVSGRPSPTTAAMVLADLDGKIDAVVDGGPCAFGLESTIVDCSARTLTVLRPGAITLEMLEAAVGEVVLDPGLTDAAQAPKAPGMKYAHYAPNAPMTLLVGAEVDLAAGFRREIMRVRQAGGRAAALVSAELARQLPPDVPASVYGSRDDLFEVAANLYRAIRALNAYEADALFAEAMPEKGIGLAIMNRLRKACGQRVREV